MLTVTAGESATIVVPFMRDDEPFVADGGDVAWVLRGQDGSIIDSGDLTGVTDSRVAIEIENSNHAVAGGRRFEKRTLVVSGRTGGNFFQTQVSYRVAPWLNMTASNEGVRTLSGADPGELSNDQIDLVQAYFDLEIITSQAGLAMALTTGTVVETRANRAIEAQALLNSLPGLRARMLKSESDGTRKAERQPLDFDRLAHDARELISIGVMAITGGDDTSVVPSLFLVTTPTDPITGA